MLQRLLPTIAVALPLVACSLETDAYYRSTGQSSISGGLGVSGGGFDLAAGEPSCVYGTVLDGEARRFTYLVITDDLFRDGLFFDHSIDGASAMQGAAVSSDHTLSFKDFTVHAAFEATREGGEIAGGTTSINGAEVEAGQWLFVVDANDPEAALVAVDAQAPELPGSIEELGDATREVVRLLSSSNDEVRALLGGS
ncbi:MAG: hypothetical protein VX460_08880 [Planctomycetota bacterium]|nr:hypothetical protein [Planctomycetota bacterium]